MNGQEFQTTWSVWTARSAVFIGAFLCWYAVWTIECTVLVLSGAHYRWLLWAPLPATMATLLYIRNWAAHIAQRYGQCEISVLQGGRLGNSDVLVLVGAAILCFVAADVGNRLSTATPYMAATCLTAIAVYSLYRHDKTRTAIESFGLDVITAKQLFIMLSALFLFYYLSHKPDADDANFVNLAIGAKRTVGGILQYDTMIGDGRSLIHLPTYKFHSFELLGAVLSSYSSIPPIIIFHLILPAVLLPVLAAVLLNIFFPALGRYWLAGVFLWMALLVVNVGSLGGWGVHGVTRFFQGKGFYVTALLPLIAALSVRWMRRGEKSDLAALTLGQVCAVGFSANGIYGGPAASGLVVLACVIATPFEKGTWQRASFILMTLAWPVIVAGLTVRLHLAFPSEVTTPTIAIKQLNFDSAFGIEGRVLLTILAFSSFGLWRAGLGLPGIIYVSSAALLLLNPLGWIIISTITGNLGFRIFWSIPFPIIGAITSILILRSVTTLSPRAVVFLSATTLFVAIFYNSSLAEQDRIKWHTPDLKVDRSDYDIARRLAEHTRPGCAVLAPERYTVLLSMIEGAPYPVFVRKLYLVHYRFTLSPAELALREGLRRIVDGGVAAIPSAALMANYDIYIGTIAIERHAPSHAAAAQLANSLRLTNYRHEGTLDVWSGSCGMQFNEEGTNNSAALHRSIGIEHSTSAILQRGSY